MNWTNNLRKTLYTNVKSLEELKFGEEDLFNVLEDDTNMKFVE
jgi:hypothetical protein